MDYETRTIRGWRTRMEDTGTEILRRIWEAPALIVYESMLPSCGSDKLLGHTPWFHRVFGPERAIAVAELKHLRQAQRKIRRAERAEDEWEREREWFREWRAKQSNEWRVNHALQKRLRRAAKPELYRAIDRRSRVKTKDIRNERARARYAQKKLSKTVAAPLHQGG